VIFVALGMNYNSVKFSVAALIPTYLLGTYFQLKAIESIPATDDTLLGAVATGGSGNDWRDRLFP